MTTASRERTAPKPADDQQAAPKPSGLLTRELLFRKRSLRTKEINVKPEEEYGPTLVAELMGFERDNLDAKAVQRLDDGKGGTKVIQDYRNYRARACAYALCNPDGSKMFPDTTEADVELVSELPAAVIDQIFAGVDELSALTKKTQDAAGKDTGSTTDADSKSKSATSGGVPVASS